MVYDTSENIKIKKNKTSNVVAIDVPKIRIVRHPRVGAICKCSEVIKTYDSSFVPSYNSTRTVLNRIKKLEEKKFNSTKLVQEKLREDEMLCKYLNQKASQKVAIPVMKHQYQDLINIK